MASMAAGASATRSPCRAAAITCVTVRSLPLSTIVIDCSPIYKRARLGCSGTFRVSGPATRRPAMAAFLLRRLGLMVLTLWLLSLLVFFAGQILPGDPGRAVLGPFAANSAVQNLDHTLGVDRPLLTRYLSWFGGLLHGSFGTS